MKLKYILYIFLLGQSMTSSLFSQGNMNNFELGTAIYRDLAEELSSDHWHAGVFLYFEYYFYDGVGYMAYSQQGGSSGSTTSSAGLDVLCETLTIGTSVSNLGILKNNLISKFKHGASNPYEGAYSRIASPMSLSAIASTAQAVGYKKDDIGYTWIDMIDPINHWRLNCWGCEEWDGTINDIDEIRCDGVVEFSYEENGIMVSNNNNIAESGNSHVAAHNDYHNNGTYSDGELCPKIQAGEVHGGNPTTVSLFDPLISANPVPSNFSVKQFPEYTQLNFRISDNASVKAYVMLQVKKQSESDWHLLVDENTTLWKFRRVDLTEWNGTVQSDNFYIPWNYNYEGGTYASGTDNYQLKITVIDQGANYSESVFNFTTYPSSSLILAQNIESNTTGGTYEIDGINKGSSWNGTVYYNQTVKAVAPNTNWVFVYWSDGVTANPRTYINPINVSAVYKNHLYSSSAIATANNNQRKITQTLDGTYFMVYESINKIWMTKSTDGVNWGNEVEVCAGTSFDICKSPSIVANENGNVVALVWQGIDETFTGSGIDVSAIYFRLYNNATGTWNPQEVLQWFNPSSSGYESSPVVSGYDFDGIGNKVTVVWREPAGLAVRTNRSGVWTNVAYIPNTNGNCLWPSITRRHSNVFAVCWQNSDADKIEYIETLYSTYQQFSNPKQVSPSGWGSNQRPSIAVNGARTVIVSWQSLDNVVEGLSVHLRENSDLWSSTITSFSSSSPFNAKPVIGTFLDLSSYYLLWEIDGSIYSTRGLGTTWTTPSIIASGSSGGSSISAVNRSRSALKEIWKKSDGQIAVYSSGLQKTNNADKFVAYRLNKHVITYLDSIPALRAKGYKGMIAFEIAGLSKQSLIGNISVESQKDDRKLRSGKFTVDANTEMLKIAGAYYAKGLQLPEKAALNEISNLVNVQLKNAATDEVMKEIWNVPLSRLAVATTTDGEFRTLNIPLTGMKGKELYLDITMADTSHSIFVNDYLLLSKEDESLKKFFEEQEVLPSKYALHQNYPNPFNPTTTIQFDLVEPQHVVLKIYNSLGQEVKELVNDFYDIGNYNIYFNASMLSSGVYFYRITAGKFVETKQFVLLK